MISLEEIYREFSYKIAFLQLLKREMTKYAKNEIMSLKNLNTHELFNITSMNAFFFNSPFDRSEITFAINESSTDERIKLIQEHKNKQFQWLLAEAYEYYEKFIQRIYAYLSYTKIREWPLIDFGTVTLSEIEQMDFDFFERQAAIKKKQPESILKFIRDNFPEYRTMEIANANNENIKFFICLVEKLRHIIVHNSGNTNIKDDVVIEILEKSGEKNNLELQKYISNLFELVENKHTIILIKNEALENLPVTFELKEFEKLTNSLLSSAFLMFEIINKESV